MLNFFHRLFFPHHKNNHRARILHNSSLFFLVAVLFISSISVIALRKTHPGILGISYSVTEEKLLELTNEERVKNHLSTLHMNKQLADAAHHKAENMFEKNYWAHFAPDGTTPWSFIKQSGYDYLYAGENLAKGFTTSDDIVQAWMNSPSHRENLLSNKYQDIGFAIMEGKLQGEDTVLVVQMFGATDYPTALDSNSENDQNTHNLETNIQMNLEGNSPATLGNNTPMIPKKIFHPLIDIPSFARPASIFLFTILFIVFVIDIIFVRRKKIPRVVGHNLDHILLIGVFIVFIILEKTGGIL